MDRSLVPYEDAYLSVDEARNALDYLERAHEYILQVERDLWAWKWVCIALHGALYGFAVTALGSSNSWYVQKYRSGKKERQRKRDGFWKDHERMAEAYKKGENPDKEKKLIGWREALEWLKEPDYWWRNDNPRAGKTLVENWESVEFLADNLRNEFMHFAPKGLSLGLLRFPKICMDVLDVIEDIVCNTRRSAMLSDPELREPVVRMVEESKKHLKNTKWYREYLRIGESK